MVAINKVLLLSVASGANALPFFVNPFNSLFSTKELGSNPAGLHSIIDVFHSGSVGAAGLDDKPIPGGSPISQCEAHTSQILTLDFVLVDPNPPQKGANLTFIAEGYVLQDIEEGAYVEVDVKYGYIRLIHQTFDLCEEIEKVDLACPIKKGKQIITKKVEIPNEVPPGKYIVNARAYTKDDEFITCLNAVVEFPIEGV